MSEASPQTLLTLRGIHKRFPGVHALDSVDFTLRSGEIHALMGENGAGKSTLIKVVTGVYPRDGGEILLNGQPLDPKSPKHAQQLGMSCVFQEVNLVATLSVAENIALGRQPKRPAYGIATVTGHAIAAVVAWIAFFRLFLLVAVIMWTIRVYPDAWIYIALAVILLLAIGCIAIGVFVAIGMLATWPLAVASRFWVRLIAPVPLIGLIIRIVFEWPYVLDWRTIRTRASAALARLDVSVDVRKPLASYSIAIQQMVAIARALDIDAQVLILDEPTSSLDQHEVKRLFDSMRKLRDQGLGIVFVTHFLDQVYDISDRITVLRNGRLVGEYLTAELPRLQLIGRMVGRDPAEIAAMSHSREAQAARDRSPFVSASGLARAGAVESVDIDIAPGEVVSLAGLLGSGRTETARLLFGADSLDEGTFTIDGVPVRLNSPRQAIGHGFGFCPEDRKLDGIIPDLSIRENIVLVLQARLGWFRRIGRARQQELADKYIAALKIATPDAEKPIKLLSGGNQQKALLARWLASQPRLLILDEPTRGIDVGAKFEIARLLEDLRKEGMAILFISSELEEVVRSADRVVVMRDRKSVGLLQGGQISEHAILHTIASEQK
ncbi:MAG: sugar ABC transporter ATP-binding protein [Tepidisphaerales bacterium]